MRLRGSLSYTLFSIPFLFILLGQALSETGMKPLSGLKNLVPEKVKDESLSSPSVVIEERVHRFGIIFEGHPVEHTFIVRNAGSRLLLIREVTTS
nr:DUF1573 domain-containing protein [Desulfobacterales bacterium]